MIEERLHAGGVLEGRTGFQQDAEKACQWCMSKVEAIEQQIEKLSPKELAAFRRWYAAFDAEAWDRQFETDVKAGKLDALADKAASSWKRDGLSLKG